MKADERRLLAVNTSRSWGGIEFWAVQVAAGMAARGAEVRFLCSSEAVAGHAREAGLLPGLLHLRADGDVLGLWRLRRELARHRPNTVLVTRWREDLFGGLAARLVGRPRPRVVMRFGQCLVPQQDIKRRLIFRLADRVIVNAPEIRDALLQRSWIATNQVVVVINGLDLDAWRPCWEPAAAAAGAALRQRLGVSALAPLLLNVGNLNLDKDHTGLLDTMARLRNHFPSARLLILGEGLLRSELEAQCRRLALEDAVIMPGFSSDVATAMAAADMLVLSSKTEGMARVLIEAAASGLPIVATDVSGSRYAVHDGVSGLVVPPRDPLALANALASLLADPDRRRAMGRRARALAEERFDAGRMLDQTAAVLFPTPTPTGFPGRVRAVQEISKTK